MEFGFSEEQQELASTVRSLLAKRADSAAVRAAAESEAGYDESLWQLLCEQIGVAALGIPEEYDGAGFTLFESLVALEEIGRSLAPLPCSPPWSPPRHCWPAGTTTPSSGCSPASPPVRSRPSRSKRPALFAGQASILLAVGGDDLLELDSASRDANRLISMDQSQPIGYLDATSGTRIGDGAAAKARAELVGAVGVAALQAGLRGTRPRHDRRLQQDPRAVRSADRLVPGAEAPDGRHARAGRDVPLGVVGGVVRRLGRRGQRRAARPRREVVLLRRTGQDRRRDRAAARRHRDHVGARRAAGLQACACALASCSARLTRTAP